MIYIKCFEIGDKCVMIVPRRNGKFSVKCVNYKSNLYKGFSTQNYSGFRYTAFTSNLSECNDIFNQEVAYLTRMYDDEIYKIAEYMNNREAIIF